MIFDFRFPPSYATDPSQLLCIGLLVWHMLVISGNFNCQIQKYCGYTQAVFTCLQFRMTGVDNFSSEKNSALALKYVPPYFQTMEQTSDGTDKT